MANISKINFKGVEYDIKPLTDSTPTQGSTNAVQSGGVYDALHNTDTTLTKSGQAADAKVVGDAIENISEPTRNLWQNGDVNITTSAPRNGYENVVLKNPLPPGTYTLSAIASSTTSTTNIIIGISKSKTEAISTRDILQNVWLKKSDTRKSGTFTIEEIAYSVRFETMSTISASAGYSGSVRDIQVEVGSKATDYIPQMSAVDRVARAALERPIWDGTPIEVYTHFKEGYIDTSSTQLNINAPILKTYMSHTIIKCQEGEKFRLECLGGIASRVTYVFCDTEYNTLEKADAYSEDWNAWKVFDRNNVITAPSGSAYLVVNHFAYYTSYTPKVYRLSDSDYINDNSVLLPHMQKPDWKNYVVATYKNMIAIYKNGVLKLSRDCGYTWNDGIDISDINPIRFYLFANGNIGFYTLQKAYYSSDWESYHESTCYEADGVTLYDLTSPESFFTYWQYEARKFVNDVDMYVFGTYHFSDDQRSLIWYTTDSGRTYKVAFEFGSRNTQTPEGSWQIRHIHTVYYYADDDAFIVTTGDTNNTECMVFKMIYDSSNDTWSVSKIGGPGRVYKWTSIAEWNGYLYYSNDNSYGSIWKCKYEDIEDFSKHECILDGMYDDAFNVVFSKNGEVFCNTSPVRNLAGQDLPIPFEAREAARVVYYSQDKKTFSEIIMPTVFLRGKMELKLLPITSNGELFGIYSNDEYSVSVCVSDLIRENGFKKAFAPRL